jgi:putative transposase
VHHSDRGSQYSSEQFQRLVADHGVVCSMSRSGKCLGQRGDGEHLRVAQDRAHSGKGVQEQRRGGGGCVDYIERFYNSKRRHSTIGYLSPV